MLFVLTNIEKKMMTLDANKTEKKCKMQIKGKYVKKKLL